MTNNNNKERIIKSLIIKWYKKNKRILPWRELENNNLPNPYNIFVSEFMLQQTTVNTVVKKFVKFVNLWPSINILSKISENRILKFWSGLGYYNRARNLLAASKIINKQYKNIIPNSYNDLITLPGVGDYTAKAIMGIAFNMPVMPIDANIERIIARINAINYPIKDSKKKIRIIASSYVSKNSSSDLIQAFMDYGSAICLPRHPKCEICMINKYCKSFKKNIQGSLPLKRKSIEKKKIKYTRAYIIINKENEILVSRRKSTGMLASMLEVPNDEWLDNKRNLKKHSIYYEFSKKLKKIGSLIYSFSHFDLDASIFLARISKKKYNNFHWMNIQSLNSSGMPTVMKKIVKLALADKD